MVKEKNTPKNIWEESSLYTGQSWCKILKDGNDSDFYLFKGDLQFNMFQRAFPSPITSVLSSLAPFSKVHPHARESDLHLFPQNVARYWLKWDSA